MLTKKEDNDSLFSKNGIRYSLIFLIISFFIMGVVSTLLYQNVILGYKINLSTLDIINFVFSIGLSTASIILAVVAIILSKKSEEVIISRNDEGIRSQNEIYSKTIDVLSKIETSTGISEKRIEDIAQQIKTIERSKPGQESRDEQIKDIIRGGLHPSLNGNFINRKSKSTPSKGDEFTKNIMDGLRKIKNVEVIKVGSGYFEKLGEDMVDGIFSVNNKRFSVSTFYSSGATKIINFTDTDTYKQYIINIASEISKNSFEKSFLIFNKNIEKDPEFKEFFRNTIAVLNNKISTKIILISGTLEEIDERFKKEVEKIIK